MPNFFRFSEYKALFYRIGLAFLFYFFARVGFSLYNFKLLHINGFIEFMKLCYYGLTFDTTAILYINLLFILLSVLPFWINATKNYQKMLFWVYFVFNAIAYSTNFLDFIYYRFTYTRSTIALIDFVKNENNKGSLFSRFILTYWHVYVLNFVLLAFWIYLYKKIEVETKTPVYSKIKYFGYSTVCFLIIAILSIGGIRGDFKKSTRPINIIDANKFVSKPEHADVVLNTPFAIIRTINTNSFKKVNLVSQNEINTYLKPIKQYRNNPETKPNIVIIITESMGREYIGAFNKNRNIPNYKSYTPFLDSLAQHSFIFTNAFANGYKSIHGMSSVIAGIPSFRDAFTSSPYPKQKIESLVSVLKSQGYDTSFFHGAANGSMGFLGFGNILGFDHYYGRTEFNNDAQFDGSWGIWDEPFLQFMKQTLDKKKTPFFSTIFTVSSHEPFIIPEKYKNVIPKGTIEMHQPVGYTDYSFKKFFETAKKQSWFKNTIFIITADHCNQVCYDFYNQSMNRSAVPILIYKPESNLVGVNDNLAQQIDIYPTILDMIGYKKPFRSWGRSLFGEKQIKPFVLNFNANQYQYMQGKYVGIFDGKSMTGLYLNSDFALSKNLIKTISNSETQQLEISGKAFIQDYMQRIIDKKLTSEN